MTGEQLRDRGVAKVNANTCDDWKNECDYIIGWLARNGAEFTAEDVRDWIKDPPHPNAMGARFLQAIKTRTITRITYRNAKRPTAHARVLAVYKGITNE
jgi:transposase InsO family protein